MQDSSIIMQLCNLQIQRKKKYIKKLTDGNHLSI